MIIFSKIKKIIPLKMKVYMARKKYLLTIYRKKIDILKNNKDRKKIICVDRPTHSNLGDHAIGYADYEFLNKYFGEEYLIIEIEEFMLKSYIPILQQYVSNDDILILQGGGNMGDEYLGAEKNRRDIISKFLNNRIVIFPQTIFFSDTKKGREELEKSKTIYNKHSKLLVVAREKISYEIMKKEFYNNKVILIPDIVLSLDRRDKGTVREGALLCIRDDNEQILDKKNYQYILDTVDENFKSKTITDTCINRGVPLVNRKFELENKWKEFLSAELVITDRLHGLIFSVITGTPCIVFSNYNHKIIGSYYWLKGLNYIILNQDINKLKDEINYLKNLKDIDTPNLQVFYKELYKEIIGLE